MTDESPAKSGDAAWREQRDAISQRNAEAHKRAQTEKKTRETAVVRAARAETEREAQQLRDLNARISKQQARGAG